jgi:hypothetical protein
VGENWYSGKPDNTTDGVFGGAVKAWTNGGCRSSQYSNGVWSCASVGCSEADYFYNRVVNGESCSPNGVIFGNVGHFTQVMWAKTAWVGCGYTASCGTLCDYVVSGNFNLPSTIAPSAIWGIGGSQASSCPSGYMSSGGLCRAAAKAEVTTTKTPWTTYVWIGLGVFAFFVFLAIITYVLYGGVKRRRETMAGMRNNSISPEVDALQEKFDGFANVSSGTVSPTATETPATELTYEVVPQSETPCETPVISDTSPESTYTVVPQTEAPVISNITSEPATTVGWEKMFDRERGAYYYYNHTDGTTQWEIPDGFSVDSTTV